MFDVVLVHADFDQCARLPPHPPRVGERARRPDVDEPPPLEDVTCWLSRPAKPRVSTYAVARHADASRTG